MAELKGFEPLRRFPDLLTFQASPFSLLGTTPNKSTVEPLIDITIQVLLIQPAHPKLPFDTQNPPLMAAPFPA
jgi:hypothetical protein